jgi:hypothetical protein
MKIRKTVLCSSLLGLALVAGPAQASFGAIGMAAVHVANLAIQLKKWQLRESVPRGMVVCADSWSQDVCRAGLPNGDFEDPNNPDLLEGWVLDAGKHAPAPYLGRTPDSKVLALPQGAGAVTGVILPSGSTLSPVPQKAYTVQLRARGSGALPANLAVGLYVANPDRPNDEVRELASTTRTVGWDWVDIDFKVDGVTFPEPSMLMVGLRRTDNNTPTLLQVDDVRIVRTRLGVTPPTE